LTTAGSLTAWQAQLVETYTDVPSLVYRLPGTVGSDHMSWTSRGYPASFLTESHYDDSDPHIHTPNECAQPPFPSRLC
jgi:leucyl aminopeptidase